MDKNGIFAFRPKQFQVHDDVDGLNWSSTDSAYKTDLLIHQLFEAQVEATPNKIFIKDGAQSVTYQLVNERANQLAGHLVCLGVKANQLVGLFAERSIETLIGIIAILKAGGAYVPIDPKLPADRIRFMLADANLGVVLTDSKWVEQLPSGSLNAVCLDRLPAEVEAKQKS
ncbi:MAG: AMP-binding protein, partial [Chloroflexota bacterium]